MSLRTNTGTYVRTFGVVVEAGLRGSVCDVCNADVCRYRRTFVRQHVLFLLCVVLQRA